MPPEKETEFTPVPPEEQLDHDDDGSDDTDAITRRSGADNLDLDKYRDRDAPVWSGE